jgi:aldehyde dehydrogenase (NAD+)
VTDALRSFSIRSMIATKKMFASKDLLKAIITEQTSSFINARFIS